VKQLESSHDIGSTEVPLIDSTIGRYFEAVAARFPQREALVARHQGRRFTYAELDAESSRLASALLRLGLAAGDRAGMCAHNGYEWMLMQLATARVGIVLVNIAPTRRVGELEYVLNAVGCRLLVTMTRSGSSDYLAMLRQLLPELPAAALGPLNAARAPQLAWVVQLGEDKEPGMLRFTELLASGHPTDPAVRAAAASLRTTDPINLQFTSGTTGFTKAATLTHRSLLNNGFFAGEAMKLSQRDRICIPVPLYHCFGMVLGNLAALTHGAAVVYPGAVFDPLAVLETVEQERCTVLHGVPTMFIAQLAHPRFGEFNLSSLRTGIMAGAPCPAEVMKQVAERMHMPQVTSAYGMTETGPASCQSSTATPLELRVSTVGVVQPHLEGRIIDPASGAVAAIGAVGEFCTRGYAVMHGYWGDPRGTREAIAPDGWLHTGDLATMDAQGYVRIVGRIRDMVIRGGQQVYPREIEELLYRHPAVSDVQVVGVPDPTHGQELCAWIVLKAGRSAGDEDIRAFCRGRIAHHKVPRYIRFVDGFPMTATGKVRKFALREAMKAELRLGEPEMA
jgi:fatty-acyl-CoA synthase